MHLRRGRKGEEQGQWQLRLYLKLIVLLLIIAYAIAFVIKNSDRTKVDFVFGDTHTNLIWLILICVALGVLFGVLLSQLYRRRSRKQELPEPLEPEPDLVRPDEAEGEPGRAPAEPVAEPEHGREEV